MNEFQRFAEWAKNEGGEAPEPDTSGPQGISPKSGYAYPANRPAWCGGAINFSYDRDRPTSPLNSPRTFCTLTGTPPLPQPARGHEGLCARCHDNEQHQREFIRDNQQRSGDTKRKPV